MNRIQSRGYEFAAFDMKQASDRKALQLKNTILQNLKKIGIREDDVHISKQHMIFKKAPAYVSCYIDGQHLSFSYTALRYIENLYCVSQVIEKEVQAILEGEKTREECILTFIEEIDIEDKRREAREILGLPIDTFDLDIIHKKYKDLSKMHHPDMGGSLELFQKINGAHKTLKKELS